MDRIVQNYVKSFLDSQEIEEKDQGKQFELFASYCVVKQFYTEDFNLMDLITGKGGDCGIDAIAIIVNGTLIVSEDEIDDLLDRNKNLSEIIFVFVQAKASSSFDCGGLGTFGAGVKDFFQNSRKWLEIRKLTRRVRL